MFMGRREKAKKLWTYYKTAHQTRLQFFSLTWRVIVVLIAVLSMLFIYDYLANKYFLVVSGIGDPFLLADRLFYWFIVGVFFGVVAIGVIYEGEYLINLNKFAKDVERETGDVLSMLARQKRTVKKRARKK